MQTYKEYTTSHTLKPNLKNIYEHYRTHTFEPTLKPPTKALLIYINKNVFFTLIV